MKEYWANAIYVDSNGKAQKLFTTNSMSYEECYRTIRVWQQDFKICFWYITDNAMNIVDYANLVSLN